MSNPKKGELRAHMNKGSLEEQIADYIVANQDNHYRLAYSYVKNVDDALDIVQDSIYKAISAKDSLKDSSYLKTWFYRILINSALDFLRKHKKIVVIDEETMSGLDSGTIDKYQNLDLQRALDELPDYYRSIIVLRYFEDLKIKEVAEILDVNINTVKTHLYKALKTLRIQMQDED